LSELKDDGFVIREDFCFENGKSIMASDTENIIKALKIAVKEGSTDPGKARRMLADAIQMAEASKEIRYRGKQSFIPELNDLIAMSFDSTNFTVNGAGKFQEELERFIDTLLQR